MRQTFCLGLFILATALSHTFADAIRYRITDVGDLGNGSASATGLNDLGQVVGGSSAAGVQQGFVYSGPGNIVGMGLLMNCVSGGATDINNSGGAVGTCFEVNTGYQKAFSYTGGTISALPTLGGNHSFALAINDNGAAVGASQSTGSSLFLAVRYAGGVATDLGVLGGGRNNSVAYAINSTGIIVGESYTSGSGNAHAFVYERSNIFDLGTLGGNFSTARAINDSGLVAGVSTINANNDVHIFAYQNDPDTDTGTMVDLGTIGVRSPTVTGINNSGTIVGYTSYDQTSDRPFVYLGGKLQDLIPLIKNPTGIVFDHANGINASGQIVVEGFNGTDNRGYLLTPENVPSPTVKISGKKKVTTAKGKLTIKGSSGGDVTSVTYVVGKKGASQTAIGTASWSFKAKLKHGKNVITVISHGYGGDSAPARITVTRS